MSKPSQKRDQKRNTRKNEKRQRKISSQSKMIVKTRTMQKAVRYYERYPIFRLHSGDAIPDWVALVKAAVEQTRLDDKDVFPEDIRECTQAVKSRGAKSVIDELNKISKREFRNPSLLITRFSCSIGQAILDNIPQSQRDEYLPFCDFEVLPWRNSIIINARSMRTRKGKGGTIFYSSQNRPPKIQVDGRMLTVGFSGHSIERDPKKKQKGQLERITPGWKTYAGLGDAFGVLNDCQYFERATLNNGHLAFSFFEECTEGFFNMEFTTEVLGESPDPSEKCYHRSGYCPAVVDGDFLIATTFLAPGFLKTPEYRLIDESDLPDREKERLKQQAQKQDRAYLQETRDFSLVKWFHDKGVPQVISNKHEMYKTSF